MNLPRYLQERLSSPRRSEGQRHQDILELSYMMIGEKIPEDQIFLLLRNRYPDKDKSDREIWDAIRGAKARNPQPTISHYSDDYQPFRPLIITRPFKLSKDIREPLPQVKMSTQDFLNLAFRPGEMICVNWHAIQNGNKWIPASKGLFDDLEGWLSFFNQEEEKYHKQGIWFRINPVKDESGTDESVSSFRHLLVEFDSRPLEEQWAIYTESDLPITAVIYSGSRSMHALIRVDAKDAKEFKERQERVYGYLQDYLDDSGNKNPSRYSRLPGVYRNGKEQKLIAVNIGAKSYQDWVDGIDLPRAITVSAMLHYDRSSDPDSVVGNRWLNKGGSLVIQGSSGIGKSSLIMQMSICFCLGKDFFGLQPSKPLKIVTIQAENSDSDLAEPLQDMVSELNPSPVELDRLRDNLLFFTDSGSFGSSFIDMFARLIKRYQPDIIICDPLLSFIGGDINSQVVVSEFLRNGVNPILKDTGVIACFVHHTGKPRDGIKTDTDANYSGLGSSELTNWARAIISLSECRESPGSFDMRFSKRGKRAGIINDLGDPVTKVTLRHSRQGILWEKVQIKPLIDIEVTI
jgi:RecA-family ATPase